MVSTSSTKCLVGLAIPVLSAFVLFSLIRFNAVQDTPVVPGHRLHLQSSKLVNPAALPSSSQAHYHIPPPPRKSSFSEFTKRLAKRLTSSKKYLNPTAGQRRGQDHLVGSPHGFNVTHELVVDVDPGLCGEHVEIGVEAGWVCAPLRKPCKAVSLRQKGSAGFDLFLKEKYGCEVLGIDVPNGGRRSNGARMSLAFPDGMLSVDKVRRDARLRELDSKLSGLRVKGAAVVRVDAEGAEWFFLNNFIEMDWEQLVVQLHFPVRYEVKVEEVEGGGGKQVVRVVDNVTRTGDVDAYSWLRYLLNYGQVWKATVRQDNVVDLCLLRRRSIADTPVRVIHITNVLWSRMILAFCCSNWKNMVDCEHVPDRYYAAVTEARFKESDMISFFSKCEGLIWVRLSTGRNNDVRTFISSVLPRMKRPFRLVTTDGDNSVPGKIIGARQLLDSPLLLGWYTQNYDGSVIHPKLHPVPIGFDLHTHWKGIWFKDAQRNLEVMKRMRLAMRVRNSKILTDGMGMYSNRFKMDMKVSCIPHYHSGRQPVSVIWNKYTEYSFGFSPHGNGLDCHRTWEMLFFGLIPVVKSSSLDALYQRLPVLILKEWEDICVKSKFEEAFKRLEPYLQVPNEMFTMKYWIDIYDPNSSAYRHVS